MRQCLADSTVEVNYYRNGGIPSHGVEEFGDVER